MYIVESQREANVLKQAIQLNEELFPRNENYSLSTWLSLRVFVLYTVEGTFVGYCATKYMKLNGEWGMYIYSFAISPESRGKGYGELLLRHVIDKLEEEMETTENIILWVRLTNITAINLYKKVGFTITKVMEELYDGEDGYVMKKVINDNTISNDNYR